MRGDLIQAAGHSTARVNLSGSGVVSVAMAAKASSNSTCPKKGRSAWPKLWSGRIGWAAVRHVPLIAEEMQ